MAPSATLPETDGRQSDTARDIVRGCRRLLCSHALASLTELVLSDGRRADIAGLGGKGEIWIVEVKSSIADFESDQKWPDYRAFCDRLYFAVAPEFPLERLPETTGIIVADRFGGEIVREAPVQKIASTTRRQVQIAFARTAAMRLHQLSDPEAALEAPALR